MVFLFLLPLWCCPPSKTTSSPWLILPLLPSYLSHACRLFFGVLPSFFVVWPSGLRHSAHLGVRGMVRKLNLLMQPFMAIASELAAPLPGSADRRSGPLPTAPSHWISLTAVCLSMLSPHKQGQLKSKFMELWLCAVIHVTSLFVC